MTSLRFFFVVFLLLLTSTASLADDRRNTSSRFGIVTPLGADMDPTRPQTKREVLRLHGWYIWPENGIDRKEAKVIAQRDLVTKDFFEDYRFTAPKVIAQNDNEWVIRFPAQYTMTDWEHTYNYLVCVDKSTGEVRCSRKDKEGKRF